MFFFVVGLVDCSAVLAAVVAVLSFGATVIVIVTPIKSLFSSQLMRCDYMAQVYKYQNRPFKLQVNRVLPCLNDLQTKVIISKE